MLTFSWIGGFNPFDFIVCPVCEGQEFTSLSAATTWCDKCNCRFEVRNTAGDPGCVVDAFNNDCWMPLYVCVEADCGETAVPLTYFDEKPRCPKDPTHRMTKNRTGQVAPRKKASWYIILKTGDSCSGWLRGEDCTRVERPLLTDKEWFDFLKKTRRRESDEKHDISMLLAGLRRVHVSPMKVRSIKIDNENMTIETTEGVKIVKI